MLLDFFLLDFSDSRFVSDSADGKNCMRSSCTNNGNPKQVHFVKAYCNSTGVRGVCGKHRYIDLLID